MTTRTIRKIENGKVTLYKAARIRAYRNMMVTETGDPMTLAEARERLEIYSHVYTDDDLMPWLNLDHKPAPKFRIERGILVSETTQMKGFESNLPTIGYEETSWEFFEEEVKKAFNLDAACAVMRYAKAPPAEYQDREGWFNVTVPVARHGIVGQFTGQLRVRAA